MAINKVQPGDPFAPSAAHHNAVVALWHAQQQRVTSAIGPPPVPHEPSVVGIRNDTGSDLAAYSVVGLGDPLFDADSPRYQHHPSFAGVSATAEHAGRFAVIQGPCQDGKLRYAVLAGVTAVQLKIEDEDHGFAEVDPEEGTTLKTAECGSAKILHREDGGEGDTVWATVRLGHSCEAAELVDPADPPTGYIPLPDYEPLILPYGTPYREGNFLNQPRLQLIFAGGRRYYKLLDPASIYLCCDDGSDASEGSEASDGSDGSEVECCDVLDVTGAGTSGANGRYTRDGQTFFHASGLYFIFRSLVNNRWQLVSTVTFETLYTNDSDCPDEGTWEVVQGASPAPTVTCHDESSGSESSGSESSGSESSDGSGSGSGSDGSTGPPCPRTICVVSCGDAALIGTYTREQPDSGDWIKQGDTTRRIVPIIDAGGAVIDLIFLDTSQAAADQLRYQTTETP